MVLRKQRDGEAGSGKPNNGVSAVGEMTNEARRLMFRDKLEGKGGRVCTDKAVPAIESDEATRMVRSTNREQQFE